MNCLAKMNQLLTAQKANETVRFISPEPVMKPHIPLPTQKKKMISFCLRTDGSDRKIFNLVSLISCNFWGKNVAPLLVIICHMSSYGGLLKVIKNAAIKHKGEMAS